MSSIDEVLKRNAAFAKGFEHADLAKQPARRLAVLACMDARIDVHRVLGLEPGDAHVLRNAGGAVTDDAIRSLAVSQRALGTDEIVLIRHTDCGMLGFDDERFRGELEQETGARPGWRADDFHDLDEGVRAGVAALRESPFLASRQVRGFVYEVETGRLREVE
jgi:carbonic anhydrase